MLLYLALGILMFISWLLSGEMRRYAIARSIMDIPNERSSHFVPTPRGGGLAVVTAFSAAILLAFSMAYLPLEPTLALLGAGGGVALLGFLDDRGHIAARWRLLVHFLGALWVLFWMDGLPPIAMFGSTWDLGIFGYALGAFFLVWLLNLYNFMDGIDGIAGIEAICVCLGGGLIAAFAPSVTALFWLPLTLGACVAGFLIWNFPPAKIFMGDAGSGFLGLVLGALCLQAAWVEPAWLWSWLILLGVFIVDATFTLVRRMLRGDKVYEAHRSHAYQYASRKFGRHLPVTMAVLVINVTWLLPLALLVGVGMIDGVVGLLVAYAPLILLAAKFKAGELEVAN